jgi:hypothetical protein
MLNKHLLTACALLVACAGGANADPAWPANIVGAWQGMSNQSPITLTISAQSTGGKCDGISGSIKDVTQGYITSIEGYYCPSSGELQFMRFPTGGDVAYQYYSGSLSQSKPPKGVSGVLMGGTFSQYNQAYGPLGQYSFSLTN